MGIGTQQSSALIARQQVQVQNQQYLNQRPPNAKYNMNSNPNPNQIQIPPQQLTQQQQYVRQQQQQQQQQLYKQPAPQAPPQAFVTSDGIKVNKRPLRIEEAIMDMSLRVLKLEEKFIDLENDPTSVAGGGGGIDDVLLQDIISRLEVVETQSKNNPQLLLPPPAPSIEPQEISNIKKQLMMTNQQLKKVPLLEKQLAELKAQILELQSMPMQDGEEESFYSPSPSYTPSYTQPQPQPQTQPPIRPIQQPRYAPPPSDSERGKSILYTSESAYQEAQAQAQQGQEEPMEEGQDDAEPIFI